MKKSNVFSLMTAGLVLCVAACNNSSSETATTDSTTNSTTSSTTTVASSGMYAARADSVRTNVSAGYYLNPRTGKAYSSLNYDTTTGALTDESGMPVRRYVDKRNWMVYDANTWDTIGSATMQGNNLMYRGTNGDWESYDKRWSDDASMNSSTSDSSTMSNGSNSSSTNGVKTKVSDHGNKVKVKTNQ